MKHSTPEADLQKTCVVYLALCYPHSFFHHSPNEGKRTPQYWNWLKSLGTKPGFPDLMIFEPRGEFCGLSIELKVGKGKTTENQARILEQLSHRKWKVAICRTFNEFQAVVDGYFK